MKRQADSLSKCYLSVYTQSEGASCLSVAISGQGGIERSGNVMESPQTTKVLTRSASNSSRGSSGFRGTKNLLLPVWANLYKL